MILARKKNSLEDAYNNNVLWSNDIKNIMDELGVDNKLIRESKLTLNNHIKKRTIEIMINNVMAKGGFNNESVDKRSEPMRDINDNGVTENNIRDIKRDKETSEDSRESERDTEKENENQISVRRSARIREKGVKINYKDMANGTLDKEKTECFSKRVRYFVNNATKDEREIRFKAEYASKVTRLGIKYFLEGRCKLFPCKKNFEYLNLKKGLLCRWCEKENETEDHVLENCEKCPFSNLMTSENFFSDDPPTINKVKNTGTLLYREYNKRNMKW